MHFPTDLIPGHLVLRYKRFLADIELETGELITAHCPNPGAMLGLKQPGSKVWVTKNAKNPKRKLDYAWQLIEVEDTLVGLNTQLPNLLVAEALEQGSIQELTGYTNIRREVPYGQNSRIDFLLTHPDRPDCYLEIKNVHLKREGLAEFPDCVTQRGRKHMAELAAMAGQGSRAVVLYVVQRNDCSGFCLARDIDPAYAQAFDTAILAGVESLCYTCQVTLTGISLAKPLPMVPFNPSTHSTTQSTKAISK